MILHDKGGSGGPDPPKKDDIVCAQLKEIEEAVAGIYWKSKVKGGTCCGD